MKKTLILALLICNLITAQEKVSFGIQQDIRLLLTNDDHYNIAPTLDAVLSVNLECKQKEHYYHSMQLFYEHAKLYSGYYKRYGVNSIWTFNKFIDNIELSTGFGISALKRKYVNAVSYQLNNSVMYKINDLIRVGLVHQFDRRNDIKKFKNSVLFGIRIN